ncbi:MAG: sulfur carrier protein ThiS [Planctomycetota bacterium]|nr:sulfur carrier protein ThiS [Planctomycetota bacterium]
MSAPAVAITLNGDPHELAASEGAPTVAALIAQLDLAEQRVAVEVNGAVVPKAEHERHTLAAGDKVEVVTFVGGG